MNRETSLYLDAVRFTAAFVVFLDHMATHRLTGGLLWPIVPFGSEAVDAFFVLSGFVIAYVTDKSEHTLGRYAVSRAARLYSVVLPALIATFVLDAAGSALRPDLYPADWLITRWGFAEQGFATQLLASITFTHQLWGLEIRPGSMIAYWSIGYEAWYYAIFGAAIFAPPRWRLLSAAILVVIAGPAIAVLLPLWLLGVLAYRICSRAPVPRGLGWALFLGSILFWLVYEILALRYGRWLVFPPPPLLKRQELPQDYLIGLLFSLNVIGFHALSTTLGAPLRRLAAPIRWAAGATFTLYLFHESLSQFIRALLPWPSQSLATRSVLFLATLGLVFAIAGVTEKRKDAWRRAILWIASSGLRRAFWAPRGAD